jgi:uncharacterized protein
LPDSLVEKKKNLEELIGRESRVAVACSGGVDSTLLLKVTCDVLGHENTIAVFADTPMLPSGESASARDVVDFIGSQLLTVSLNPLVWPEFTANPLERCYICKKKIYQTFLDKLTGLDFTVLMDGTNLDDLSDFRPGLKALEELEIKTPLAEAGLTKKEIRSLSRNMNLPNWNKHSSSCLATRVATDQHINKKKLDLISECENVLHGFGFMGCRVRISDDSAMIEVLEDDIGQFTQDATRQAILKKFNDSGLEKVLFNLTGRKGIHF